jgi:hypothetical protein
MVAREIGVLGGVGGAFGVGGQAISDFQRRSWEHSEIMPERLPGVRRRPWPLSGWAQVKQAPWAGPSPRSPRTR